MAQADPGQRQPCRTTCLRRISRQRARTWPMSRLDSPTTPVVLNVPMVGDPAFDGEAGCQLPSLRPGPALSRWCNSRRLVRPQRRAYLNSGIVPEAERGQRSIPRPGESSRSTYGTTLCASIITFNDKWQILGHYMHDTVSQAYTSPMVGWSGGSCQPSPARSTTLPTSAAIKLTATISPTCWSKPA